MRRSSRAVALSLRVTIGLVFAAAAVAKSADPVRSIDAVAGFHLLPPDAVVGLGAVLPGFEAAVGAALLLGLRTRAAAVAGALLATTFAIAVGSVLLRGLDVECGCLGSLDVLGTASPALLAVDLSLLAACVALAWMSGNVPSSSAPSRDLINASDSLLSAT